MQGDPTTYTIQLPQFEGPFDLLLFFIERDELDIQDIPISRLTSDFLAYILQAEALSIDVGSEFILMAAKLMKIKAAMLLPRLQLNAEGEPMDPRQELAERLLAFKQFKRAAAYLAAQEEIGYGIGRRGFVHAEATFVQEATQTPADELFGLNLYSLLKTYERILERHRLQSATPRHVIQRYAYTVEQVREDLLARVAAAPQLDFVTFAQYCPDRIYLIFSFLAMLELVQRGLITIVQGEGYNNFYMIAREQPPVMVPVEAE